MDQFLARFFRDESGATAIEYGLIAALIFVVALGAMSAFGTATTGMFDRASTAISDAVSGAGV